MTSALGESPLLRAVLPTLYAELESLLEKANEPELLSQLPGLVILKRCGCGDDFCGSFYTQPPPKGAYGENCRTLLLGPERGMILIDVAEAKIAFIEILNRNDIRDA
jgi:hypothetical protein